MFEFLPSVCDFEFLLAGGFSGQVLLLHPRKTHIYALVDQRVTILPIILGLNFACFSIDSFGSLA